jgi:cobaltochelatase CobN
MRFSFAAAALLLGVALPSHGAASDRCIAYVGVWDRSEAMLSEAAQERGYQALFARAEDVTGEPEPKQSIVDACELVFMLNMQPVEASRLRTMLEASKAAHPNRKVLALDLRASQSELEKAGLLTRDEEIQKYWRANGSVNVRRLLGYVLIRYLGEKGEIQPVIEIPDFGYYDPDREDGHFPSFVSYREFKASRGRWQDGAPIAALLIQQSFWITHDTKVIAAQVKALERHGINPVVIFGDREGMITAMLAETHPDAIIEDRHGAMWESHARLEQLDVPYFRPISLLGSTIAEWKANPQGMAFRDVGLFMTVQESWGTIEPVVVGGLQTSIQGLHMHDPEPGGIERFAGRVESWMRLRRKAEADKRVAIVYYNPGLGKDDLMRGSPTGMFLDGPESAMRFLPEMKRRGYTVDPLPKDVGDLMAQMRDHGRNLGPWAQPALEELADHGNPVLIPCDQYERWFHEKLSPENQERIIAAYGPPPGKFMVVERHGTKYIVLPRLQFGNVVMMPQPARGQLEDHTLVHSRDVPPPHNYLAFYWWLQDGFKADAVMHWGTHGTLEMLPGKEAGMTRDDWPDICIGNMPNIDLWIMDNLAEATLARRRSYAVISDHMVPPAVNAGLAGQYRPLREDIEKFKALEGGLLKERYRSRISAVARGGNLQATLKFPKSDKPFTDEQIKAVADYVEELSESREVLTMHTLGQPPDEKFMASYLTAIAGHKFLQHLEQALPLVKDEASRERQERLRMLGETAIAAEVLGRGKNTIELTPDLSKDIQFAKEMYGKLEAANEEVEGLFRALDGRYMKPGPGPEPIRNPASIPGGRNLYALNPEEIPTKPAWEVGVALVDEFLKTHHVRKVGMDFNGMDTMRDFGVMEAQTLYLMGVRPVWDRNGLAVDVELIPRADLKRPRIDVFLALGGLYKENFSTRVQLLDKAVRLVSQLKEVDNYVREGTLENEKQLLEKGMPAERASSLAAARIFGAKPGDMSGTNILYLVPNSGAWEKQQDLTDVYIDHMSYVYTNGTWGEKVQGLYEQNIQGTQALIRVWASNMTSQLSNHHAYEYLGGLSMAVRKLTGKQPEAYIADVRDSDGARMRSFDEVLATNFRTELLNQNWVKGMKEHGYAGAGQVAELVKNTFGWSVTREGSVDDATWSEIYSVYFKDKFKLGTRDWMNKDNPHAMQEMAAIMMEATRKGYWKTDQRTSRDLARTFTELVAKYGKSGGVVVGGNPKLAQYIAASVNAPGERAAQTAPAKTPGAAKKAAAISGRLGISASLPMVSGQRLSLKPVDLGKPVAAVPLSFPAVLTTLLLLAITLAAGYASRRGAI